MAYGEERSSGGKTVLIVLGIIGGIFLLVVLACAGLVFLVVREMRPMMEKVTEMAQDMTHSIETARAFVNNVKRDRLEAAYAMTTDDLQARLDEKAFEELIHKHPGLAEDERRTEEAVMPVGQDMSRKDFTYTFDDPGGKPMEMHFTLVKEGTTFKVDELTIKPVGNRGTGWKTVRTAPTGATLKETRRGTGR